MTNEAISSVGQDSVPADTEKAPAAARSGIDRGKQVSGWMTVLTALVYVLIVWGALVRLTGSGMSIPDWPFINGSLLPPMTETAWAAALDDYVTEALSMNDPAYPADVSLAEFKGMFWIEYLHRTFAALAGILFLVTAFLMFRDSRLRGKLDGNIYTLAALLLAQAGLGGVIVLAALPGLLVAVHLMLGYLFFAVLIWTALKVGRADPLPGGSRSAGLAPVLLGWAVLLGFAVQAFLGGLIAGMGTRDLAPTWPLMFGAALPPADLADGLFGNSILAQFIHRWWALALFGLFLWLWLATLKTPLNLRGRAVIQAAGGLFAVQILIGIFNVLYSAPALLSVIHSAAGAALLAALLVVVHELRFGVGDGIQRDQVIKVSRDQG